MAGLSGMKPVITAAKHAILRMLLFGVAPTLNLLAAIRQGNAMKAVLNGHANDLIGLAESVLDRWSRRRQI
jgi:hypothetical protein